MQKEQAIKIITDCAKDYRQNLANKNLAFIFGSAQNTDYFETLFLPRHFLHLTGVHLTNPNSSGSVDFYNKCLQGKLRPDDFSLTPNGTAELKLSVLPRLVKIHRFANMVGNYNNTKSLLYTEKLAGNVYACLGFVLDGKYYIPNTALKEDIRNVTIQPHMRILAILRKSTKAPKYNELCYSAKSINLDELVLPSKLTEKTDTCLFQTTANKPT